MTHGSIDIIDKENHVIKLHTFHSGQELTTVNEILSIPEFILNHEHFAYIVEIVTNQKILERALEALRYFLLVDNAPIFVCNIATYLMAQSPFKWSVDVYNINSDSIIVKTESDEILSDFSNEVTITIDGEGLGGYYIQPLVDSDIAHRELGPYCKVLVQEGKLIIQYKILLRLVHLILDRAQIERN